MLEINGAIHDRDFSASSMRAQSSSWGPSEGRLNNTQSKYGSGAWCADESDERPWLSVKLTTTSQVTRIAVQGAPKIFTSLVKKYMISYSMDGKNWSIYEENGKEHVSPCTSTGF